MRTLRQGCSGKEVEFLQSRLSLRGFHVEQDGDFGPKTTAVVKQFQASANLKADGVVGDKTWSELLVDARSPVPPSFLEFERQELLALMAKANPPTQVQDVLHAAISQLGAMERDVNGNPSGSNGGKELVPIVGGNGFPPSEYYLHWKVTDPNVLKYMPPWCALFVSYALKEGLKAKTWKDIPFGDWFGGCSQIEEWAKKNGRLTPVMGIVSPMHMPPILSGLIFTMARDGSGSDDAAAAPKAGHTGFIVAQDGYNVRTIEGNVSNRVESKTRVLSSLLNLIRWW